MKQLNISRSYKVNVLLFLLCGSFILFSSCHKDKDYKDRNAAGGPPTIERVRLTDPTTADSSLKQAGLGSTVVIVGTNLANTQSVTFNGYPVAVNPTYATNNYLIVSISDSVPTIATNPNVSDTLKVITPLGVATYHFKVLPPRPVVDQISNEYSGAGATITLYGKYFFFIDSVAFPGGKYATTGIATNSSGTSLTVTIPAGIDPNQGDVKAHSASGWSAAGRETKLYDITAKPGMMLDWDTKNSWGGTLNFGWGVDEGKKVVTAWTGITPLSGKFSVIDMSVPGNWGWSNDKVINMNNYDGSVNSGDIFPHTPASVYDPNTALTSFDLKLEMSATKSISGLQLQVWQNDYTVTVPLSDYVKTTDGKWYTVSANLGNMAKGANKLAKLKDLYATKELRVLVVNPTASDVVSTMGIDNIRMVRVVQ